ncbi:MAG: peptide-methionine (S)-S-oxide reductase MsrA [Planctomycetes bacterium]|nr:peptide-methionine (S)-S-oxide reductase MsrA [Planctomycetota bacterium]
MSKERGTDGVKAAGLATFGGGCFWCTEAMFERLLGVVSATSGYSGGHVESPTYEQVCAGDTGHAEAIQVAYDPAVVSFEQLLEVFFATHDPTTKDRQGADIGPQYRSVVFFHDGEQKRIAREVIRDLEASGAFGAPIVTEIAPFTKFWPAEEYHQEYFDQNPSQGYCRAVIAPKVAKFEKVFADRLKRR